VCAAFSCGGRLVSAELVAPPEPGRLLGPVRLTTEGAAPLDPVDT